MKRARVTAALILFAGLLLVLWFAGAPLVQDATRFDIDGDGVPERILLVWRSGNFGAHRPTWVLRDEVTPLQHIFIYTRRNDGWHAIWMSSQLGFRARTLAAGEMIPGTGRRSLVITEADGTRTRWGWLTWGLTRL